MLDRLVQWLLAGWSGALSDEHRAPDDFKRYPNVEGTRPPMHAMILSSVAIAHRHRRRDIREAIWLIIVHVDGGRSALACTAMNRKSVSQSRNRAARISTGHPRRSLELSVLDPYFKLPLSPPLLLLILADAHASQDLIERTNHYTALARRRRVSAPHEL